VEENFGVWFVSPQNARKSKRELNICGIETIEVSADGILPITH
jgi:hypothetical protein